MLPNVGAGQKGRG